jgi:hypothetical protein
MLAGMLVMEALNRTREKVRGYWGEQAKDQLYPNFDLGKIRC